MRTVAAIASLVNLVTPLFDDRFPSHAALNLFQHVRDPDACAAECWFAVVDGGVGHYGLSRCFGWHDVVLPILDLYGYARFGLKINR